MVTLTMNNPEKRNSLSGDETGSYQADDFEGACNRVNADMSVKVVILTGAGKAFSAGGDIFAMRDKTGPSAGRPVDIRNNYRNGIQRVPQRSIILRCQPSPLLTVQPLAPVAIW